jgi:hypothetical protein
MEKLIIFGLAIWFASMVALSPKAGVNVSSSQTGVNSRHETEKPVKVHEHAILWRDPR